MGVRRYSARELADGLGLHIRTIQRAANRGDLEAFRTPSGRFHLVSEPALNNWMGSENLKTILALSQRYHRRRKSTPARPDSSPTPADDTKAK